MACVPSSGMGVVSRIDLSRMHGWIAPHVGGHSPPPPHVARIGCWMTCSLYVYGKGKLQLVHCLQRRGETAAAFRNYDKHCSMHCANLYIHPVYASPSRPAEVSYDSFEA